MSKRVNQLMVHELGEFFKEMDPCVLISYIGISAEDATKMRATLREKDISLRVIKNRLSQIALKEAGRQDVGDMIDGPTAMAVGGEDPIVLAKAIAECLKGKDTINVTGGFAEGQALDAAQVEAFANCGPNSLPITCGWSYAGNANEFDRTLIEVTPGFLRGEGLCTAHLRRTATVGNAGGQILVTALCTRPGD